MDISSIALTMAVVLPVGFTCDVDEEVVEISLEVIDTAVANTPFGAKCSANVEGIVVLTVGITVGMGTS